MKKLIISIFMMLALGVNNSSIYAQSVVRSGNTFAAKVSNSSKDIKTKYTWKDSKGIEYPIYVGRSGSCYVIKVSKKTGKEYKQYLGVEVSSQICKELGIKYEPKKK